MRLDKFLCEMNMGTRSQVKDAVRKGLVAVNGIPAKSADMKINENTDKVAFRYPQPWIIRRIQWFLF